MSGRRRLKVALVGCGQIADAHLQEIARGRSADVVAVCDRQIDLARQAAARFRISAIHDDFEAMLAAVRPDVVHITTPPHTHYPLARTALAAGAHVYVEKPFTVDVSEADLLLAEARRHNRLVCVGHDQLYDPVWEECRRLHQKGVLGDVVHVDSTMGYDLDGPYGRVLAADPEHWVHRLPGGLFQNTMSHPLYKITDFLLDEEPMIWAHWYSAIPDCPFPTDLRAMFRGSRITATLTFLSQAKPGYRIIVVHGTRATVEVHCDTWLLRRSRGTTLRGALAKIEAPFRHLTEAAGNLRRNLGRFLRAKIHWFAGMHRLIGLFHEAILEGKEPPIAYAEIRRVTALMDRIFRICKDGEAAPPRADRNGDQHAPALAGAAARPLPREAACASS
jgi:predicted dehydrogenase